MNIRRISYGLVAAATMLAGGTSCNYSYRDKAKADAMKYLSGTELIQAEHYASQQPSYEKESSERIAYWNSILANDKAQEAYALGRQMVKDSVEGKNFERPDYTLKLDTIITQEKLVNDIKNKVAEYHTAEEFKEYRENEPNNFHFMQLPNQTHYWNLIANQGLCKEEFEKGAADMRKELSVNSNVTDANSFSSIK